MLGMKFHCCVKQLRVPKLKIKTRQVCNLFQRPVEQILGFYPKELNAKRCLKNV